MGKFKVNEDQMTLASGMVGDIYERMAQELMLNLIKRIKQRGNTDLQREPWLWQLEKLNDMHMLNEQNVKYIIEQTGIAQDLFNQIIKNEGLKVYKNTQEQLAEELGKNPPHNDVKMALESYAQQAFKDVNNLVNQTLLSRNSSQNTVMKTYQSIIETAVAEVVSGVKTADQAINDTVMKWLSKGFPSDFIDKAGRRWNIDSYARMVTQSTTYRVYNDMRTRASEELGVETFYYSKHGASRPACAPIQGKVVTKGQSFYSKILGYRVESLKEHGWGTAGGALGANCKHYLTPFIIGVNTLPDVPEHLKNITPEKAIENGRKQAQQRAYERAIKDDKYKLQAAKILGDERRMAHFRNMLRMHRSSLNDLIEENEFLHRDYTRERIYKTGKAQEYAKAFDERNKKAYNDIKEILGDRVPSFEVFMKLSKTEANLLKHDSRVEKYFQGEIREPISEKQKKQAVAAYYEFKKHGITFGDHGIARYVESLQRKKNGTISYNFNTILKIMNQPVNYSDGRDIRFYDRIMVVTEKGTKNIVTIHKYNKPKKRWEKK